MSSGWLSRHYSCKGGVGWEPRLPDIMTDPSWTAGRWMWYPLSAAAQYTVSPKAQACMLSMGKGAGGACCEGCAAGKGCESKQVGALLFVTDAEVRVLGDEVAKMATDVDAAAAKERAPFAAGLAAVSAMKACRAAGAAWDVAKNQCKTPYEPDPDGRTYLPLDVSVRPLTHFQLEQWTPFQERFNAFLPLPPGAVHSASTFEELSAAFKALHDQWTAGLGQATRAAVPPPPKPVVEPSDVGALLKGVIYIAAIGAAVVYGLPILLPKVLAAVRK